MKSPDRILDRKSARSLLFIGYYDISEITSAPQVRISAMMTTFKSFGCNNVIVGGRLSRAKAQLKWIFYLRSRKITHAYIENSTSTAWPMDLLFLIILKLKKIKIGIFIRDVYPAFHYFRSKLVWYQVPLYWGWHLSVRVYVSIADHIFTPTEDFVDFLKPRPLHYSALPPAMSQPPINMFNVGSKKFLYLGGISELYGLEYLANSLERLAVSPGGGGIDFITREVPDRIKQYPNASIQSMSYAEITKLEKTYLGGIIATHEPYSQITVNVKLFDYFSLGLPVIMSNMRGNVELIANEKTCIIAGTPEEIPDLLEEILSNPNILLPYKANINNRLYRAHNWENRVLRIMKKLNVKGLPR